MAIDPTKGADDIVSPGHVFPLVARTAACWSAPATPRRRSTSRGWPGLIPAGVICEIMNDDGTMARLPDLVAFAQLHGLKIGTIADLIAYRRRTERSVERVLETPFDSVYGGGFRMMIYRNTIDGTEHVALVKGEIEPDKPTLVRMHRVDFAADMLGHVEARRDYVPRRPEAPSATMTAPASRCSSATPTRTGCPSATAGGEQPTATTAPCATTASGPDPARSRGARHVLLSSTRSSPPAWKAMACGSSAAAPCDGEDSAVIEDPSAS